MIGENSGNRNRTVIKIFDYLEKTPAEMNIKWKKYIYLEKAELSSSKHP